MLQKEERNLRGEHRPEQIRRRLSARGGESALGDAVLGGVDGIITTFAVVAGSAGAQLPAVVIIVLGLANLIADAFSMAVSNYLGTRSRQQEVERAKQDESWQIDQYPEGERREIREIFGRKGFRGATLDRIVEVITRNRDTWVDTMLREELNLSQVAARPLRAALATFIAFVMFGFIPLVPFVVAGFPQDYLFPISAAMSAVAFLVLGVWKGFMLERPPLGSGIQTLLIGGIAAVLAYSVGALLHDIFGVSPSQAG